MYASLSVSENGLTESETHSLQSQQSNHIAKLTLSRKKEGQVYIKFERFLAHVALKDLSENPTLLPFTYCLSLPEIYLLARVQVRSFLQVCPLQTVSEPSPSMTMRWFFVLGLTPSQNLSSQSSLSSGITSRHFIVSNLSDVILICPAVMKTNKIIFFDICS